MENIRLRKLILPGIDMCDRQVRQCSPSASCRSNRYYSRQTPQPQQQQQTNAATTPASAKPIPIRTNQSEANSVGLSHPLNFSDPVMNCFNVYKLLND